MVPASMGGHPAEGAGSGRGGALWPFGQSTSPDEKAGCMPSCLLGNSKSSAVTRAEKAKGGGALRKDMTRVIRRGSSWTSYCVYSTAK